MHRNTHSLRRFTHLYQISQTYKVTFHTLSMSFQHFSTIFLSTTAGWWGWRGCWCGWKASFIKPMRPAPLLGFPAIKSESDRGLAPGLRLTTTNYSWHVLFPPTQPPLCVLAAFNTGNNSSCKVCQRAEQKACVRGAANVSKHATLGKNPSQVAPSANTSSWHSLCAAVPAVRQRASSSRRRQVKSPWGTRRAYNKLGVLISHTATNKQVELRSQPTTSQQLK